MYRYNKKSTSLIFGICLMLGIIMFGAFGATFAYFQVRNYVEQAYTLGSVNANWIQNGVEITGDSIYINTEKELVRGEEAGVDVLGGMLSVQSDSDTVPFYVRIKYVAYVEGVEVPDITNNLVLRVINGSNYIALGDDSSEWMSGGDGWYYNATSIDGRSSLDICNNIMLKELDQAYLSKELAIKLQFETLQSDNNAVEALWGESIAVLLGLKEA